MDEYDVEIFNPEGKPTGITVFLPGTLMCLDTFQTTVDCIVEQSQVVIGFKLLNPLPIVGKSHNKMAEEVAGVVAAFRALDGNEGLPSKYNIVGHSLGGKVALMVAAKFDIKNVNKIIALDPVDAKPRELTAPRLSPRCKLSNSEASEIHLFQSEKGGDELIPLCPSDSNASVVKEIYPDQISSLFINEGAGHMAYQDTSEDDASVKARGIVRAKIAEVIT
jgi:pimeloyl-ACP methyl ester carboxylesterase